MDNTVIDNVFVFVLAAFVGFELIKRVSPLLHTPLMSLTNAISAISIVGALIVTGSPARVSWTEMLGTIAIAAAMINVVSGFLITDRMLKMFKTDKKASQK
jgi:H+-translocating NAD(P) transhydrogenase subunit alpha